MEGWRGWDEYAPFYDWENARTLDGRDARFWRDLAARVGGPVLELGCGTGRVTMPVARAGVAVTGVDRSSRMLARAGRRLRRARSALDVSLVRADIRALPFIGGHFPLVIAPYGVLQSLLGDDDLAATLESVARAVAKGGVFGVDLVADVPRWDEYRKRVRLRGPGPGARSAISLVETVRQDRRRGLTIFEEEYRQRRGGSRERHRFSLAFRTLSVPAMRRRLEAAGFCVTAALGDYDGRPWDSRADVWVMLARRT